MDNSFILLTEKDSMWAEMLIQVLKDNNVRFMSEPVYGAGFTLKSGKQERLRIFVPITEKTKAEDLLHELFPSDNT